jgi:PIN domain nuclease of toxin-antitoxin system
MSIFLLDTHALIWWMEGINLPAKVVKVLTSAVDQNALYYSPISFWEVGMLDNKGAYAFLPSFQIWTERTMVQRAAT